MATLFLICGLPGSGKTTLSRQLESSRQALRLCPDEWIAALLADPKDIAERDRLRDPVEKIQWEIAKRSLILGINVVLEFGFWSRAERLAFRKEAEALGARVELHYLEVSREELWNRLAQRNENLPPGTFRVSQAELHEYWDWFEPPAPDEF